MYDHSKKKFLRDDVTSPVSSSGEAGQHKEKGPVVSSADAERRGANRHAITAVAEIVDLDSGARFSTRTSDLGPGGCFVDSLTPFPIGSKVRVTVRQGNTEFEIGGTVVYSQIGLGMGIAFDELAYEQRLELEGWLAEVTGGKQELAEAKSFAPKVSHKMGDANRATLVQLVQLLVNKRILTDSEGASVLQDPFL
jgi:PilZ domain